MADDRLQCFGGKGLLQDLTYFVIDKQVHFLFNDGVQRGYKQAPVKRAVFKYPIGPQGLQP